MLIFESFNEIEKKCNYYNINNHTINDDGSVDVDGDVILSNYNLDKLPVKFGKINGSFSVNYLPIKTMEGCPYEVSGEFYFEGTDIKTLEGGPKKVGSNFVINNNKKLTSLLGGPKHVGGDYQVNNCKLTSLNNFAEYVGRHVHVQLNSFTTLEGLPKHIHGDLYCSENYLTTLEGGPEKIDGDFVSTYTQLTNLKGIARCGKNIILRNNILSDISDIQDDMGEYTTLNLNDNELTEDCIKDLPKKGYVLCLNKNFFDDVYGMDKLDYDLVEISNNPINVIISPIITQEDFDKIEIFNTIKPIKEGVVNLKRVKYLWSLLFPKLTNYEINRRLNIIEERGYKIVG